MPTFSICVPTVNRPETLASCLQTLTTQPGTDFEILVSDDQGPPANKEVVDSLNRPDLIRYIRTPQRLGMRGNYEFCVEQSRGDYVTILGDDDGLCVNALVAARDVLAQGKPDVMFWFPHLYWWPNALIPQKQWMLYVYANPHSARWVDSRDYLKEFFANGANPWLFERLPSIYNGFVSRGLLQRLKDRTGNYFCDEVPDVYSGIANAVMAQSAVFMERALTIRGLSGKSYGVAFRSKKGGAALKDDFKRHMATPMCEPEFLDSTALAVHIASIKLRAIRRFSELSAIKISIPDVIKGILTELNEDEDRYDDLIADARALVERYGLDGSQFSVPAKAAGPKQKHVGVTVGESGRAVLAVDGQPLNVRDIYQASLFVRSVLG